MAQNVLDLRQRPATAAALGSSWSRLPESSVQSPILPTVCETSINLLVLKSAGVDSVVCSNLPPHHPRSDLSLGNPVHHRPGRASEPDL